MMAEVSLFLHLFILSVLVYYNCYFRHEIRKDKFGSRFPEDYSTSLNFVFLFSVLLTATHCTHSFSAVFSYTA